MPEPAPEPVGRWSRLRPWSAWWMGAWVRRDPDWRLRQAAADRLEEAARPGRPPLPDRLPGARPSALPAPPGPGRSAPAGLRSAWAPAVMAISSVALDASPLDPTGSTLAWSLPVVMLTLGVTILRLLRRRAVRRR